MAAFGYGYEYSWPCSKHRNSISVSEKPHWLDLRNGGVGSLCFMYGSVIRYKSNPLFQFRVIFTVKLVPTTYLTHFHGRLSRVIGENMLLVPTQAFAAVVVQPNKSIDDEHKSQLDYMLHWIQLPLFDSSYDPYPFNIQLFHCGKRNIYIIVSLRFTLS